MMTDTLATTIKIGWTDKAVAHDTPVPPRARHQPELLQTDAIKKAIRHLAIEIGGKAARAEGYRLVRLVSRLANQAAGDGVTLRISGLSQMWTVNDGLAVRVWGVKNGAIQWDIVLYSSRPITWRCIGDGYCNMSSRADVALREIKRDAARRKAERKAKVDEAARKYMESLPEPARALQATCRVTCLQVSADAQWVTERLHDVGGTFGYRIADLTGSLADLQRQHDETYHPDA